MDSTSYAPSRNTVLFIVFLALIAGLLGYNFFFQPFAGRFAQLQTDALPEAAKVDEAALATSSAFPTLTTRRRIAQLLAVPLVVEASSTPSSSSSASGAATSLSDASLSAASQESLRWIASEGPGVVVFFGSKVASESAKTAVTQIASQFENTNLVPLLAVDHEGGVVQRFSGVGFTKLPAWKTVCEKTASESARLQTASASELAAVGINIVFAPVLDLAPQGGESVLESRVCEDESKLGLAAGSFIESFARFGIMSVVKHFPGLGQLTADPHVYAQPIATTPRDLQPFTSVLDKYSNIGVMTSHVSVMDYFGGVPCSLSSECLDTFALKYADTVLFTDALEMQPALDFAASKISVERDRAVELAWLARESLMAGNHVLVFGESVTTAELTVILDALEAEYDSSEAFRAVVEKRLLQVETLR